MIDLFVVRVEEVRTVFMNAYPVAVFIVPCVASDVIPPVDYIHMEAPICQFPGSYSA